MYWQREACDALQERGETDDNTELVKVSGHPLQHYTDSWLA